MDDKNKAGDIIKGHKPVQSSKAKWLCLEHLYEHFHRPNFYDIGGTYLNEEADYWFLYKTEQVSKIFLLHLFVCNRQKGSFSISLCNSNELDINYRTNTIYLNYTHAITQFDKLPEACHNYLTTYSFSELDIELMINREVLISVSFNELPQETPNSSLDFQQLIADPVGADFKIATEEGHIFNVHKFLLAERSEVFKAMLKGDTAENSQNYLTFKDVSKDDFSPVIEFFYTGTVKDLDSCNCFNLLMLADRYYIKGLKELAQHSLTQNLSTDNALETLIVADMYNCQSLKTTVFKFIKSNISSLEYSVFQEISNVQLLQDLCKYLVSKY